MTRSRRLIRRGFCRHVTLPAATLLLLLASRCTNTAESRFLNKVRNKPALDFELPTLDGGKVRLSELRGKPVIVAFFAYG